MSVTLFAAFATAALSGDRTNVFTSNTCAHTLGGTNPTWWLVDLGLDVQIKNVIITSRDIPSKKTFIHLKNVIWNGEQYVCDQ